MIRYFLPFLAMCTLASRVLLLQIVIESYSRRLRLRV